MSAPLPSITEPMIGRGTYGKVFRLNKNTILKQCSLFENNSTNYKKNCDECNLNIRNFKEIIILSSLQAPFIPKIKKIQIKEDKILIEQEYCGKTLKDFIGEVRWEVISQNSFLRFNK